MIEITDASEFDLVGRAAMSVHQKQNTAFTES